MLQSPTNNTSRTPVVHDNELGIVSRRSAKEYQLIRVNKKPRRDKFMVQEKCTATLPELRATMSLLSDISLISQKADHGHGVKETPQETRKQKHTRKRKQCSHPQQSTTEPRRRWTYAQMVEHVLLTHGKYRALSPAFVLRTIGELQFPLTFTPSLVGTWAELKAGCNECRYIRDALKKSSFRLDTVHRRTLTKHARVPVVGETSKQKRKKARADY